MTFESHCTFAWLLTQISRSGSQILIRPKIQDLRLHSPVRYSRYERARTRIITTRVNYLPHIPCRGRWWVYAQHSRPSPPSRVREPREEDYSYTIVLDTFHDCWHELTMQRYGSINAKVSPTAHRTMSSHPVTMPVRSASHSSALSDNEAIPTGNPVNVWRAICVGDLIS